MRRQCTRAVSLHTVDAHTLSLFSHTHTRIRQDRRGAVAPEHEMQCAAFVALEAQR